MEPLAEIVKILSEDSHLLGNRLEFVHLLGISETKVASLMKLFALGQCQPYDLIHGILSEWINIREGSATVPELMRILRGGNFNLCSDKLRELEELYPGPIKIPSLKSSSEFDAFKTPHSYGNPPREPKSLVFGVKDVVLDFMGREEELTRLNEYFHSRNCRSVLLSGLGGIGKTELARNFTISICDTSGCMSIVKSWLAGESPQSLLNSTTQLCHHLRLPTTGSDGQPLVIQKMLQNIYKSIKATAELSRWLVVIDNVHDIHNEFQTALKTVFDFGPFVFLLVTSRCRYISTGKLLQVEELKLADSVKFIKNSLKTDESSEEIIATLCCQLGNFPLALTQAVAYIEQQQRHTLTGRAYGVSNYLDDLAKNETLGLDGDHEFAEYPKSTTKVWHLTLDKIQQSHGAEGKMALNLLDVMAFLISDNIQIPFLHKLYNTFHGADEIGLDEIHSGLTILLRYSLISSCNSVISINRLVQLALREKMASSINQDNETRDLEMLNSFWASFNRKAWSRHEIEMANILQIWRHSCSHPALHEQIAINSHLLCIQLNDLGMVNELYDFSTECCKFLLAFHKKAYLLMEHRLAVAMKKKGLYESSLDKFTFVYGELKELCGEDDDHTLAAGVWIALVLFNLDRCEESLEWGHKVLQSNIRIYGENNESTIRQKRNVAMVLTYSGKEQEALKLYKEILEWQEVHLGKEHPSTLETRHDIAVSSHRAGNYAEALDILQDLLPLRQKHLGVEHRDTLITKRWLANTLDEMGEIDEALKIMEEVAVAMEKVLGPDNPETKCAFVCSRSIKTIQKLKHVMSKASI